MGYVTTPLFHILRMNTHGYNLTDMSDLLLASKETIFDDLPMEVIDSSYRDRLILGFALHYFEDEIGKETIPAWKISLSEKLVNNAEFINQVFERLDKQVLGNYKVHRGQHADNNQELASVLENDRAQENRTYIYLDNQTQEDEANRQKADNGSMKNQSLSSDNEVSNTANASDVNSQNQRNNASTNITNGTNLTEGGGYTDINANVGNTDAGSVSDSNSLAASLDTPQGSISAMRTPAGSTPVAIKGTGIDAEVLAQYRYLTNAATTDGSTVTSSDSQTNSAAVNQHINQLRNEQNTQRQNGSDASKEVASTEQNDYGMQTNARTGNTDSEQVHTSAGFEKEQSLSRHQSDRGDAGTKLTNEDREHASEKKGSASGNEFAEDIEFSNELVMKSLPYMKKIWNIFDKCFLGTFEIGGMF